MDCRERGSETRGVYPTQDTSRMGTEKAKQEEADTRILAKKCKKSGRNVGTIRGKTPKQNLTSAKVLTIRNPEGGYHAINAAMKDQEETGFIYVKQDNKYKRGY